MGKYGKYTGNETPLPERTFCQVLRQVLKGYETRYHSDCSGITYVEGILSHYEFASMEYIVQFDEPYKMLTIHNVRVVKEFRRAGMATEMCQILEETARRCNIKISTVPNMLIHTSAVKFWNRMGYKPKYKEDNIWINRVLNSPVDIDLNDEYHEAIGGEGIVVVKVI